MKRNNRELLTHFFLQAQKGTESIHSSTITETFLILKTAAGKLDKLQKMKYIRFVPFSSPNYESTLYEYRDVFNMPFSIS